MSLEDKLKRLRVRRGQIKAQCTRALNIVTSNAVHDMSSTQLSERKAKFEITWSQFDEVQAEIEILQDSAEFSDTHENERTDFEEAYYDIIAKFQDLIIARKAINVSEVEAHPVAVNRNQTPARNLRLPKIDLPSFSGVYEEWYPFHDTFQSLIHRDTSITEIQKFHYLKSSLKGEAVEIIRSLEISSENYNEAWQMLKRRYDNKRLIIQKHIKALFELQSVSKENHAGLRHLVDGVLKHVRALKAIGRPTESWDDLIIHLITGKLDHITNKEWENSITEADIPNLQRLTDFLEHRCHMLEAISRKNQLPSHSQAKPSQTKVSSLVSSKAASCQKCKGEHQIYACEQLLKLSPEERQKVVKENKLCWNCMKASSHTARTCRYSSCKTCGKRHNTLLHLSKGESETIIAAQPTNQQTDFSISNVAHTTRSSSPSQIFLSTALIDAKDCQGKKQTCRILLDSGSQSNFVTEDLVRRLGLVSKSVDISIVGVNQACSKIQRRVQIQISSRHYAYKVVIDCLVLKQITERLPGIAMDKAHFKIPSNLTLADPEFYRSTDVDILLGAEMFWNILCVGQIKESSEHPLLQKTLFGWIIGGKYPSNSTHQGAIQCNVSTNYDNLEEAIERFWQTEQVSLKSVLTAEERQCEKQFEKTYRRTEQGRFIVQLPIKEDKLKTLGRSYETALKRFYSIERKLNRNPEMKKEYVQFMQEYLQLGHMHSVTLETRRAFPAYYMPHHAVFKATSSTTRTRVVFDASCKTDTGASLNDILMVGPTLQKDLISILIKFRIWQYVLIADVAKMYRQVLIDKSQQSLQRILWRDNDQEDVKIFELATVTYGTASASFLAIRALQEIARLEQPNMPIGAGRILSDFYVDDFLTGANTIQDLITIRNEVNAILNKAGFSLRKWASNEQATLEGLSASFSNCILSISEDTNSPTLGLQWNASSDTFQFRITTFKHTKISKRSILSTIARIFDPLGILGPIIVTAKIIMQRLWQLKIDWDETVPSDIQTQWSRYESELHILNYLQVQRKVISHHSEVIELCGFSDASERAYGACVYVRSKSTETHYEITLLCAKSRVTPLKNLSLPRLELCAAVLLSQLMHKVMESVDFKFTRTRYWSDSTITLAWIKSAPRKWSTFVANRVSAIQDTSDPNDWYHVDSLHNPADIISKGMTPALLLETELWWKGPPWLSQDTTEWPAKTLPLNKEVPEQRKTTAITTTEQELPWLFDRYSTFNKLIRIHAYILRFINICYSRKPKLKGNLSSEEINGSVQSLVKIIQSSAFSNELKCLRNHRQVPRNSKLLSLSPFLDEQEILRVGGRLQHANLPYSAKHQMVLPSKHSFTKLLVEHEHSRLLHAGAQTTLAAIRQKFWPLDGRNTVRHVIRKCIKCFRTAPVPIQPIMGNLPPHRVQVTRAFASVGVDFCGPFQLRESKRRNAKILKSYVAIFVCLVTKAVHIETAFDLTAEGFIHILKRFIGRRGLPGHIFSDNATNFVGAERELKELQDMFSKEEHKIIHDMNSQGIQWHFIPPRAPNFGGIWEAAVRSFKTHLKRVVGTALLTVDEMQTLAVQIEAILNSRPLTVMSNDPNDLSYLSPGHFLIGDTLTGIPEPTLLNLRENRLSRWQRVEQMRQHLWKRWSKDYLNQLQQRTKWRVKDTNVSPGDMVLVREDNTSPLCWPLGRVQEIHPGADGVVRTATIKTAKGLFKRPSNRLSLLPLEQ